MNKTNIKNFAIWARNKLRSEIAYKAGLLGISEKGIAEPLPQSTDDLQIFDIGTRQPVKLEGKTAIEQRRSLVAAIKAKRLPFAEAFDAVIEEVAYTWFNRLIAVRFMEVNDYLPSRMRVLSSDNPAKAEPDFVTSPFDTDLDFTEDEINLIDNLKDNNKSDELFQFLFIKQCNKLNEILPELFEKTNDYTELLLNVSFTDKDGVVYHLVHDISEDDFNNEKEGQVEIIGWLYQYYNTELKDETFALLKKNVKITKERIPASTQLFTPDWIVRYMVENSLGRLWCEGHPDFNKSQWEYYLLEAEQEPEVEVQLKKIRSEYATIRPEEIKVIDPCMGSGHILVYAFDVLMQIYTSTGWSERDAAKSIIENNLYGLDIDDRAGQLAYFAIMMKARKYSRRILNANVKPSALAIRDSNWMTDEFISYVAEKDAGMNKDLLMLRKIFRDAKEYGSIINVPATNCSALYERIDNIRSSVAEDLFQAQFQIMAVEQLLPLVKQAQIMSQKYDVVVTNPPYMGKKSLNQRLSSFLDKNYPNGKSELYSAFILKCIDMTNSSRFTSMITIHTWMFISSFEGVRDTILRESTISSMMHTGAATFEELNSFNVLATAFSLRKKTVNNYISAFLRLADYYNTELKLANFDNKDCHFYIKQNTFEIIPGNPFVYWITENARLNFSNFKQLRDFAEPKQGLATGDNNRFVRNWQEVDYNKIGFLCQSAKLALESGKKWFPYNKGGGFRKWYGMNEYVINWENNAFELKNFKGSVLRNPDYYFKSGITWSLFGFENFGVRYKTDGFIFDVSGSSMFPDEDDTLYILAFLASTVSFRYLSILAPTVNFQVGNIGDLPLCIASEKKLLISEKAKENIAISKYDWDGYETSWDFKKNPLLLCKGVSIEESYENWKSICESNYLTLKANEERINREFINIYNLSEEMTEAVQYRDITVHRIYDSKEFVPAEMEASAYVMLKADVVKDFISYAVGCMFGRYSLDSEGLVYAGGDWDSTKYKSFIPDEDNCIPITDTKYFDDDIVGRFCEFIKVVYGEDTLEENLDYIAQALGNKGNSSREVIRNYFLNDFYKDHCKIYQKRPIYWLFDSGKQNGFKALIYIHRYNADTIGNLRVEYLHRVQRIYESEIEREQDTIDHTTNAREKKVSENRKEKLQRQLKETKEYDEKIAHLALSRIEIDLDDGVKTNYDKIQTGRDGKKLDVLGKI